MTQIPPDKVPGQIDYWHAGSLADLATATDIIQKTTRFGAGLFFLHLAIEKSLKALYVKRHQQHAPMTHNLLSLTTKCGLVPNEAQESALATINEFNLEARYPDDRKDLEKRANKLFAEQSLKTATELFQWISQNLHP